MQMLEPVLKEFREECAITKRVLDRLPADKLTWKPHRKSMSLGALALHIASVPGALARISQLDEFDAAQANFQFARTEEHRGNSGCIPGEYSRGRELPERDE